MQTELRLAQHGMGMQEGTIVKWLKQEGESFAAGDVLVEVESAKSTVEVEAESAGVLLRIIAQPGDEIPVGEVIAEIDV